MDPNRPSPPYPEQLTVSIVGKRVQLKNIIGNMIMGKNDSFTKTSQDLVIAGNHSFKTIITPNFFDEEATYPDQQLIDIMAMCYPGPNLFILTIDSENTQQDKVMAQVKKLQDMFGEGVTAHLVVLLPDVESYMALGHLKELFTVWMASSENIARDCRKLCCGRQPFQFDYKNYSQQVVVRRKATLEARQTGQPLSYFGKEDQSTQQYAVVPPPAAAIQQYNGNMSCGVSYSMFNIVLLGASGTGKSASANTILLAGNPELEVRQLFRSQASSVPITTECEFKTMEKPFGVPVRVVDTPDFFHEEIKNSQQQLERCKNYCQPGQCVVLLVMQLGRYTADELEMLEKLEHLLGWKIRDSTIVLLTHREDVKESMDEFVQNSKVLKAIVSKCGGRFHAFSNTSKDTKQVMGLFKKIPECNDIFPKFIKKKECYVC